MKKVLLSCLVLLCLAEVGSALNTKSYDYRLKIPFSGYTESGTLTNFPALIILDTGISAFDYGQFDSTNGYDLRFTDSTRQTELNYEIEEWDTSGSSYVWVQVPTLTSNTYIFAYWGNAPSAQQAYTTNGATWTEGYLGVYHLAESSGGTNAIIDSTTNNYHGSDISSPVFQATGQIGLGIDFENSSNQYITLPDLGTPAGATLECWIKLESFSRRVFIGRKELTDGYCTLRHWSDGDYAGLFDDGPGLHATNVISTGTWHYAALDTGTGITDQAKLILDGVELDSGARGNAIVDLDVDIGAQDGGDFMDGIMDEVRISNVSRSSNWIWACWMNQASNSVFCDYEQVILPQKLWERSEIWERDLLGPR